MDIIINGEIIMDFKFDVIQIDVQIVLRLHQLMYQLIELYGMHHMIIIDIMERFL